MRKGKQCVVMSTPIVFTDRVTCQVALLVLQRPLETAREASTSLEVAGSPSLLAAV
jgi:hypothetical protein